MTLHNSIRVSLIATSFVVLSTSRVASQPFGEGSRSLIGTQETVAIIDSIRQLLTTIDCTDSCFLFVRVNSFAVSISLDREVLSILLMSDEQGSLYLRKYFNRVIIQDRLRYYDGYFVDNRFERLHLRGQFTNMVFQRSNEGKETWAENSNQLSDVQSKIVVETFLRMVP